MSEEMCALCPDTRNPTQSINSRPWLLSEVRKSYNENIPLNAKICDNCFMSSAKVHNLQSTFKPDLDMDGMCNFCCSDARENLDEIFNSDAAFVVFVRNKFSIDIANVILMCERCKTSLKEFQNHLVTYKRLKGDGEVVEQYPVGPPIGTPDSRGQPIASSPTGYGAELSSSTAYPGSTSASSDSSSTVISSSESASPPNANQ